MAKEVNKTASIPEEGASEEIVSMTREEAMEYLGLPKDADRETLDKKFWQLSKNYRTMRGDDAEQKLADLSAAYDIATGERDEREKAAEARMHEKKFFGKTKAEWKNYVSYTWKYYVGAVIVIAVTAFLIWNFFKPKEDCGIVSIGNFEHSEEYYDGVLKKMGFKMPSLVTYCYVPMNDEGQEEDRHNNQAAVTFLYSGVNVIVTDSAAMPYFFEYFTDCTKLYSTLKEVLPAEKFAKIKPVYMSEREYKKLVDEYRRTKGFDYSKEPTDLSSFSDAKIMTGLLIEDEEMIKKLGYRNYWQKKPASVVLGMNVLSKDQDSSFAIITAVLNGL